MFWFSQRKKFVFFILFLFSISIFFIPRLIFSINSSDKEILEWPKDRSRDIQCYLTTMNDTAILKPMGFHESCVNYGFVWIFVTSATENFLERKIIRQTWGDTKKFNSVVYNSMHQTSHKKDYNDLDEVKISFLVGIPENERTQSKLEVESKKYGDIIQESFIDSPKNSTIKSMYILKWAGLNPCIRKCKFH